MAKTHQVEKLLYGKTDAAFALSVSARTIDYMIANKKLATRRLGGRVLIPASEVKRIAAGVPLEGVGGKENSPEQKDTAVPQQ